MPSAFPTGHWPRSPASTPSDSHLRSAGVETPLERGGKRLDGATRGKEDEDAEDEVEIQMRQRCNRVERRAGVIGQTERPARTMVWRKAGLNKLDSEGNTGKWTALVFPPW